MALYSWGANSHGQLSTEEESEQELVPTEILNLNFDIENVKEIKGGGGHVIILNKRGEIYACGWNNKGQLGNGTTKNINKLSKIVLPQIKFKTISCGWDVSAGISVDNDPFIWGKNYLQINNSTCLKIPAKLSLPNSEIIKEIQFGLQYGIILTENHLVYLFGKVKFLNKNILELTTVNETIFYRLILNNKFPKLVKAGQKHIIILVENNEILMFGDNKHEQLLDNNLKFSGLRTLFCGWTHTGCLTNEGDVYLWGRNSYGQLGSKENGFQKLKVEEKIDKCYLGSEHGLAITIEGSVYTWGWNEHGNCGNGKTDNIFNPVKVNLIGKCIIAGCGAGFCYALMSLD